MLGSPRVPKQLRMDAVAVVPCGLVHFNLDAMRVGPSVLTNAGDLPGNLHVGLAGLDGETAISHFCRDDGLRELADHGELIPKIGVQRLEPRGHRHHRCAARVRGDVPVVDVHHVGRFDEGVVEVLISGVERVIDLKGAAGLAEMAVDVHIAREIAAAGAGAGLGVYSIARCP